MSDETNVTQLLHDWRSGKSDALNRLMPMVHDTLRKLAGNVMRSESDDHTLQATALINEAYLRLIETDIPWQDRSHFLAIAARNMRHILIDHARSRGRQKRGGDFVQVTLHEAQLSDDETASELLDLEKALESLIVFDERKARVIEMRFFGGMTFEEIGAVLGVSAATAMREFRFAKAWLYREMSNQRTVSND